MSSYFQHFDNSNNNIDFIVKDLNKNIYFIENYVSINEVLDYFKLPKFTEFDFNKKYNLIELENVKIIKLRFNDINEWQNILSEIFQKDIIMYNDNVTVDKYYFNYAIKMFIFEH